MKKVISEITTGGAALAYIFAADPAELEELTGPEALVLMHLIRGDIPPVKVDPVASYERCKRYLADKHPETFAALEAEEAGK